MIDLEDRQRLARDIQIAQTAGARLKEACNTAGIDTRTLQRWKAHGGGWRRVMVGRRRCGRYRRMP